MNNPPPSKKTSSYIIVVGLLIVIAIPVLFFFRKSDHVDKQPAATVTREPDIASLEKEVRNHPDHDNLVDLSLAYINSNEPGKAIPYLQQALALKPQSAIAYNNLGVCHIMQRDFPKAIEYCTKAVRLDSNFQLAKNNLQWAYDEQKKVRTGLAAIEQTPAGKRNVAFYVDAGMQYYQIGDYEQATRYWKEGLLQDRNNPILLNNIGTALMMRKELDSAVDIFRLVLQLHPDNQLAKNNLQWALSEKNKTSSAK